MKTQNTNNNKADIFAYILVGLTFAFIIGASIQIFTNL